MRTNRIATLSVLVVENYGGRIQVLLSGMELHHLFIRVKPVTIMPHHLCRIISSDVTTLLL